MKLQNAKGTKDYLPEEMIVLNDIMSKLRNSFEKAGYNPITTPLVERFDVLSAKYAGGSEILKETFKLTDQGDRELGLRYDLTVPFARVVGQNPQLKMPFKRYQMEKVYRDGPIGMGRYREFFQCDIDIVGSKSMKAEAELLSIVEEFFLSLDLKPVININNRKILDAIFSKFKVFNPERAMLTIDKWEKVKPTTLIDEMIENGEDADVAKSVIEFFSKVSEMSLEEISSEIGECDGISEISELLNLCKAYGLSKVKFNGLLARGLSYYTSTMIEVKLVDNKIESTVCAGGRYDKLIQNFLGSKEEYPTVGLSFGLSRIFDAILSTGKNSSKKTVSEVFVYGIGQDSKAIEVAKFLRNSSINAELDLMDRKPGKNLKYAQSMEIPFVIVIGENEVNNNTVSLKTADGFKEVSLDEAVRVIKG